MAIGGAEGGSQRKNCTSEDQDLMAGCIIIGNPEPKWKFLLKGGQSPIGYHSRGGDVFREDWETGEVEKQDLSVA
jgi:hypothetical protein